MVNAPTETEHETIRLYRAEQEMMTTKCLCTDLLFYPAAYNQGLKSKVSQTADLAVQI